MECIIFFSVAGKELRDYVGPSLHLTVKETEAQKEGTAVNQGSSLDFSSAQGVS
jgi:hypothetical protein